jgi:hypothetical protein
MAVNMAAPESVIEQLLKVISVIHFAGIPAAIWACLGSPSAPSGFTNGWSGFEGFSYYGDHHSMAIAIVLSSEAW